MTFVPYLCFPFVKQILNATLDILRRGKNSHNLKFLKLNEKNI